MHPISRLLALIDGPATGLVPSDNCLNNVNFYAVSVIQDEHDYFSVSSAEMSLKLGYVRTL